MRLSASLAGLLALVLAAGCAPTCAETCEKLLDCGVGTERQSQEECEDSCDRQYALYELWEDEVKADLFDDHKTCVMDATCGELEEGVCYDEELYVF